MLAGEMTPEKLTVEVNPQVNIPLPEVRPIETNRGERNGERTTAGGAGRTGSGGGDAGSGGGGASLGVGEAAVVESGHGSMGWGSLGRDG